MLSITNELSNIAISTLPVFHQEARERVSNIRWDRCEGILNYHMFSGETLVCECEMDSASMEYTGLLYLQDIATKKRAFKLKTV